MVIHSFNHTEFQAKRQAEYDFFLFILKDLGEQGLRPHQALEVLNRMIEKTRHATKEDKFYWEGVFGPQFSSEKPDNLPPEYNWETLNGGE